MLSAIVLVPGACQPPIFYLPLAKALQEKGMPTKIVDLPSVGTDRILANFDEDVAAVRNVVFDLIKVNFNVVVAMHSYGGLPGSAAMKGLGEKDRANAGTMGSVVRLVYITSFVLREGEAVTSKDDYTSIEAIAIIDNEVSDFSNANFNID